MRIRETIDNPSTASTESPPEDVIVLVDSALVIPAGTWSHGWGVPMATDTAFAIALIAVMGAPCPGRVTHLPHRGGHR